MGGFAPLRAPGSGSETVKIRDAEFDISRKSELEVLQSLAEGSPKLLDLLQQLADGAPITAGQLQSAINDRGWGAKESRYYRQK